jgi:hypothetical protein
MSAIHNVRNPEDIEHAVTTFAQTANGGLIVWWRYSVCDELRPSRSPPLLARADEVIE